MNLGLLLSDLNLTVLSFCLLADLTALIYFDDIGPLGPNSNGSYLRCLSDGSCLFR